MSKQQVRYSDTETGQVNRQVIVNLTGMSGLFLLLLSIVWLYAGKVLMSQTFFLSGVIIIFSLHALLVLVSERMIAFTPIRLPWRYRLALLISVGIALFHWLLLLLTSGQHIPWIWMVIALSGAVTGGLLMTWIRESLWEDNSPPSATIRAEVKQLHTDFLGNSSKSSISKRIFDYGVALIGLTLSSPVWLVIMFMVWFEEPGPILFVKNSVGLGGKNFHQFKFRTMVRGAEISTGPVLSGEDDGRVLLIGRILRKTALDELPQLLNILKGEMSFVGPRPQRTVLVYNYLHDIPEYAERHRVLPGLSGLAQVAGDYYLTPRQKLRYDRLYIRRASLGLDLKLLCLAFLLTFWYRWQKDWDGRLPRRLLHRITRLRMAGFDSHPDPGSP